MRWGVESSKRIIHALALVSARMVLLFVVGMGIVGGTLLGEQMYSSGWKSILLVVVLLGVLDFGLILNVGLLRVGRTTLEELGWRFDTVGRDIALGVVGFIVCTVVLFAAMIASGDTLGSILSTIAHYSVSERVVFLCIAVFGAAAVEESLFRGYLQPALASRVGLVGAIVIQALIFDVMHMNFRPGSLVVKFVFGMVFGVLRGRDRSLLAPGIAHGLVWAVIGAP